MPRRGPAVLLLISLLAIAAYGAQRILADGWSRIVQFRPVAGETHWPTAGPPPLTNRLVLILVDGLRMQEGRTLISLEWLNRQGATYSLTAADPFYQIPTTASILSGAPPIAHGLLFPSQPKPLQSDNLLAAAKRVQITTGGTGGPVLKQVASSLMDRWEDFEGDSNLLEPVRALLDPSGPRLVLIQIDRLLSLAPTPNRPAGEGPEVKQILTGLDSQLVQILELIDLKTSTMLVTGTVPTGVDWRPQPAKTVPLIMVGKGIKSGVRGNGSVLDIAPTVAALLGLPTPLHNQGSPLLPALQVEARPANVIMQRMLTARQSLTNALLDVMGEPMDAPDPPAAMLESASYIRALDQQVREAEFTLGKVALTERAPYIGGVILLLLLYLVIAVRQPYGGPLVVACLAYLAFFHLAFFLFGGHYSARMDGFDSLGPQLVTGVGLRAAGAMTVASVLAGYLLSRRGFKKRAYLAAASLHITLSIIALHSLPVAITLLIRGWDFPLQLPAPGLLVWFLTASIQVIILGYMSPIWAAVSVTSNSLSYRYAPPKEVGNPERNADKVVRLRALKRSSHLQSR